MARIFGRALAFLVVTAVLSYGPPLAARTAKTGIAGPYLAAVVAMREGDVRAAAEYFTEALASDPHNRALMGQTLTYDVAAGRIEQAADIARQLREQGDEPRLATLVLAVKALHDGVPARARKLLRTGKDKPELLGIGRVLAAWAAFDAGDVDTARAEMKAEAKRKDGDAAGRLIASYHLALLEAAAGDDRAALAALDRAARQLQRESLRMVRVRAGILARLGRVEEARKLVSRRLADSLGNRRLELLDRNLANGRIPPPLVRTGREGAAEVLFGVASLFTKPRDRTAGLAYGQLASYLNPDLVEARLLVAEFLFRAGQYQLAIETFERIPADAPEAVTAAIERAEALFKLGRREEAIVLLRETARANPRSLEVQTALGSLLRRAEHFAEAAEAYSAAIALIPKPGRQHWTLFYQRGIAYERSKQWDKAEADFFKALELEPDQPLVLNYLGYSWVEMGKNLDQARKMIEKAVEQRPGDGFIIDSLGWVLFRMGQFEEAVKHLEHAVELEPVDPVINDHYGDALWMVGRRKEARFQWKRALSFGPEEKDAERIRRKLAVGLDKVLAEEKAAGKVTIIRATESDHNTGDNGG